jgi:hypothetical protein
MLRPCFRFRVACRPLLLLLASLLPLAIRGMMNSTTMARVVIRLLPFSTIALAVVGFIMVLHLRAFTFSTMRRLLLLSPSVWCPPCLVAALKVVVCILLWSWRILSSSLVSSIDGSILVPVIEILVHHLYLFKYINIVTSFDRSIAGTSRGGSLQVHRHSSIHGSRPNRSHVGFRINNCRGGGSRSRGFSMMAATFPDFQSGRAL